MANDAYDEIDNICLQFINSNKSRKLFSKLN